MRAAPLLAIRSGPDAPIVHVRGVTFECTRGAAIAGAGVRGGLTYGATDELGYAADPVARALRGGRTGTIGVLVGSQPLSKITGNARFTLGGMRLAANVVRYGPFRAAPLGVTRAEAHAHVEARSVDLAQVRPELGHATNAVCIIGPRWRTRGLFLDRRAFLVSYDPAADAALFKAIKDNIRKDIPVNTLKEFAVWAKANESKLNMAHAGVGSVSYIGCLILNSAIGIKPTMVPFTGTAPAIGGRNTRPCNMPGTLTSTMFSAVP